MLIRQTRYLPGLAAMVWGVILPGPAHAQTATLPTRLEFQVRGEAVVVPDRVVISAGVVTQAVSAGEAMRENAVRMSRLRAALKQSGIATRDIQTQMVQLSPQYRYAENAAPAITGYQAVTSVAIQFRDVGRSGAVLDTLVREGANQINGPTFVISDRAAAEDKAREAAVRQVQQRAALYARATGLKIGRIVSLSEAGDAPSPMPMLTTRAVMADGGAKTEIMAGEQQVAVVLTAVIELN